MMDPFVAAARSPSSGSDDDDDGGDDDESPGCSAPPADYLDDNDSVIFDGEDNEPTINALCNVDICIEEDDDDEFESESRDSSLHDCRWNNCDRRFTLLDKMVAHVNDDHVRMEDVNYSCKWEGCTRRGKSFNARYKMLIHMRTHTNEKPHRCLTCDKRFSRMENLKIHNRSHTGEKPYMCPVKGCSKAYSNSSDRFKHTRTHFDDKPFVCKRLGCGKRYTDPSSLRKHTKTFGHRDQPINNNGGGGGRSSNDVAIDLTDVGSSLLFDSRVHFGTLTMNAGDTVSLAKASMKKPARKSKPGIKKISSALGASAKLPGGHLDRTITLD